VSIAHDAKATSKRSGGCLFSCSSKNSDMYIIKATLELNSQTHCWDVRKRISDFEALELRLHTQIPKVADSMGMNSTPERLLEQMPELPPKKSFWSSDPGPEFHEATSLGLQKYIETVFRMSRRLAAAEAASGARLTGPFDHEISMFLNMQFALKQQKAALAPLQQEKAQLMIEKEAYKERSEELEREKAMETVEADKNKMDLFQQLLQLQDEIEDAKSRITTVDIYDE